MSEGKINEYAQNVTSLSATKIILKQAKAPAVKAVGVVAVAWFFIGKSPEFGKQNKLED